jgi:hypothetical protein
MLNLYPTSVTLRWNLFPDKHSVCGGLAGGIQYMHLSQSFRYRSSNRSLVLMQMPVRPACAVTCL